MSINLKAPELRELKPRIMVCGVGGAGGNAVNNMINSGLAGVDFIVANTDAQALTSSKAERIIQMGLQVTEGLGAGSQPEIGRASAEEAIEEIRDHLTGAHMVFVTAGMGGGTGTGAAPVIARCAREMGILTVGVVTKPFQFEGARRMRLADGGIEELHKAVDTLIVIPNQNLFRVANEKTTFADAFSMADQVLYSGVACITDLMVREGLINLDFADVRAIMRDMGKAMMGTGEASGDRRSILAAEAAIANPLLDEVSMKGAKGLLISITGGQDMTLYEVDEAASRIRQEVDEDANIILGATFDSSLEGIIRVSVVATGIDKPAGVVDMNDQRLAEFGERLRAARQAEANQSRPAAPAAEAYFAQPAPQPEPVQAAPAPAAEPVYAPQAYTPPAPQAYAPAGAASLRAPGAASLRAPGLCAESWRRARPARAASGLSGTGAAPVRRVEAPAQGAFIPPAAEQPLRPQRMPSIEEFPEHAQALMRQRQHPAAEAPAAETKRRTLMERLASFGMSRAEDHAVESHPPRLPAPQPQAPRNYPPRQPSPSPVHAEYAKRPAAQRPQAPLDPHGRALPRAEDDQLEIPAFLRRQSN